MYGLTNLSNPYILKSSSKNKKVVYTALFGEYDLLKDIPEESKENGVDYICFTNFPLKLKNWKILEIKDPLFNNNILNYKYFKFNPHIILPDYEESIWIDSYISLQGKPFDFFSLKNNKNIFLFNHQSSFKKEENMILNYRKESPKNLEYFKNFVLSKIGQNIDNLKLFKTAIIYRKHHSNSSVLFSENIFKLLKYQTRDQLILPYVIFDNDLEDHIGTLSYSKFEINLLSPFLINSRKIFYNEIKNKNDFIRAFYNEFFNIKFLVLGDHLEIYKKEGFRITLSEKYKIDKDIDIKNIRNIFINGNKNLDFVKRDYEYIKNKAGKDALIIIEMNNLKFNLWKDKELLSFILNIKNDNDYQSILLNPISSFFDHSSFLIIKKGKYKEYKEFDYMSLVMDSSFSDVKKWINGKYKVVV